MDDPGPNGIIFKLITLFCLILVNAFFALSEMAIISLNENKLSKATEDGNKKAQKLLKLTTDSTSFLSTIQIGVTFAGFLTSATAATSFAGLLSDWLCKVLAITDKATISLLEGGSIVVITIALSFFSLVLGELVPKRVALHNPEKVSYAIIGPVTFFKTLFRPFVAILSVTTNLLLHLFGIDPNNDPTAVTEDEIRMLVDAGEENGVIEESQKEMINNIFEFDDIAASEIMTHRTDMIAVDLQDSSFDDVVRLAIEEGCSRIPVYDGDIDDIKGIIHVKDLLRYVGHELPEGGLNQIIRKAHFVPESKKCGDLFTEMTEKRIQMCIVFDEYGGTAGLVTIEDLIESIVGNIQDEYDDEDEDNIERIDDTTYTVDGTTNVDEVSDLVDVELPEGDYDTIGGLIMSIIGRIPDEGENVAVTIGGCELTVEGVSARRIERVRVKKLPTNSDDE